MSRKRSTSPAKLPGADVQALAAMASITQLASGDGRQLSAHLSAHQSAHQSAHPSVPPPPPAPAAPPVAAAGVAADLLSTARVLYAEQNKLGATRLSLVKRFAMRGSRLFTHKLVAAGQHVAEAVDAVETAHGAAIADLARTVREMERARAAETARRDVDTQWLAAQTNKMAAELDRLSNGLHAQLTSVELAVDEMSETTARTSAALQDTSRGLSTRLGELERTSSYDRSELHRTRALVSRMVRSAAPLITGEQAADGQSGRDVAAATAPGAKAAAGVLDDRSYADFEHRFRGTRDEIRARQQDALQYVQALPSGPAPVLDLGCGRGEWLQLLAEQNIPAYGVDDSPAMIEEATGAGADARLGDALDHLAAVEDSSLHGVTAFQFVEHISLGELVRLLDNALLALRPGGLLLLETPNPANLIVGAANFYLDPTHVRPLHPDFLSFLAESRGFVDVQVQFVHPEIPEEVLQAGGPEDGYADPRLDRVIRSTEWALFGPRDYLLVARRAEVAL